MSAEPGSAPDDADADPDGDVTPRRRVPWLVSTVLFPFAVTRLGLLVAAWFAEEFAPSWTYHDPVGATRGWLRVPPLVLDVWGRYDTDWYLGLAARGYTAEATASGQSSLAFFPLYPAAVRAVHALVPGAWQGATGRYLVAIALSNAFALGGLSCVFLLVREVWRDDGVARRTTWYVLLFPGAFFLSAAYSESLFLLLSAATFLLAWRGRWWYAAVTAFLLGLTRATGVLIAPALALLYLSRAGWDLRRVRADAVSLLAAPTALATHAVRLALLSGDPLSIFHAQSAWGRSLAAPWTTLSAPWHARMGPIDLAAMALFAALGVALAQARRHAFAAYVLLSLAPILLSGTITSATRFLAVVFPAFVPLAQLARRDALDRAIVAVFTLGQTLLFVAWARFYWVA